MTRQTQKAGEHSNQMQVENQLVYIQQGVTEERVRCILNELIKTTLQSHSKEAQLIAQDRIKKLEDKILEKLVTIDNGLSAFADPAFQLNILEAQKSAACTEREDDYETLALLLEKRAFENNRKTRTGIIKVIEVVGEVSDDALLGLTLMYSIAHLMLSFTDFEKGLLEQDSFFANLIYHDLPKGVSWIEQLELLNLIRIDSGATYSDLITIQTEKTWHNFVKSGIHKDSDNYKRAIDIFESNGFRKEDYLIDHYFNPDYVLVNVQNSKNIFTVDRFLAISDGGYQSSYNKMEKNLRYCIEDAFNLYVKDKTIESENKRKFKEKWNSYPNLKKISDWWSDINIYFDLTASGKVLSQVNSKKYFRDDYENYLLYNETSLINKIL